MIYDEQLLNIWYIGMFWLLSDKLIIILELSRDGNEADLGRGILPLSRRVVKKLLLPPAPLPP